MDSNIKRILNVSRGRKALLERKAFRKRRIFNSTVEA